MNKPLQALVADLEHDTATEGLDVHVVGGAVRDALLGVAAGDRDWVVVGASPEDMVQRRFTPVGGDFPVFLHPRTHEEFALARTERKVSKGYRGFTFHAGPDVTLEEDLQRRDLTVNAMAVSREGQLTDPWQGRADLQARLLRHVGPAFVEDPVRILRLARFAARFTEFSVADETLELCRRMVASGEVDALVPERVWREVSRGLVEAQPARLFEVLISVGALERVVPEWHAAWLGDQNEWQRVLQLVSSEAADVPRRYALLATVVDDIDSVRQRLRVPNECADLARIMHVWRDWVAAGAEHDPAARLALIERCDGLRRPERFVVGVELAARCWPEACVPAIWLQSLAAVQAVDAGEIARRLSGRGPEIRDAVKRARLAALATE